MIRIIVSGGGTAGHINPAIAIVQKLEHLLGKENVEALFVGALGKMEMDIIPKQGYNVIGLPVRGFVRSLSVKNIKTAIDMLKAIKMARGVIDDFKPHIIIGFGGYASVPMLYGARRRDILCYIWEGNSFAGAANRLTSRYAKKAFISYESTAQFFPTPECIVSGNPINSRFFTLKRKSEEALAFFGVKPGQKVLFITGGSLGARKLNNAVLNYLDDIKSREDIFLIWQTGRYYYKEMMERVGEGCDNIWMGDYISHMEHAYSAADLVVCRSGASTVTEVASGALAVLFVPSSGVTDDHQTKNAAELVASGAAELLTDATCESELIPKAFELLGDDEKLELMRRKIVDFAKIDAAEIIVKEILKDAKY